jgi:riboflavin kinase/FMN adenylyltransferase
VPPTLHFEKFEATQITTNYEKRKMFADAGVDYLVEYPFNENTASMEPLEFIRRVIAGNLNAAHVVVGADWHFGKDRSGSIDVLMAGQKLYNYEVHVVEKEKFEQREISSTWIREEIQLGNMENVNILLGYPYMIIGNVEEGRHLGKEMGFATVNIYPSPEKLLPPYGVYASKVIVDGREYYAITNIGVRPTFNDSPRVSVETHLLNHDEDLYGREIRVELMHFERPEIRFDTVDKLASQVEADIEFTKTFFLL